MEVCFLPKQEIIGDLQSNPKFSFDVLKEMAQDLKEADDIIVNMAQKSVRQRLAETLVYIQDNFGVNPDRTLSVLLSREDFANIVGTARKNENSAAFLRVKCCDIPPTIVAIERDTPGIIAIH